MTWQKHNPSDLAFWFRAQYLKEMWSRVSLEAAGRPVALYGAGRHTRWLLATVDPASDGPRVTVILDDDRGRTRDIGGVPVRRPASVEPSSVAAVIVSTDTLQRQLGERARAWAAGADEGHRPRVVMLYDGLPDGPYELVPALMVREGPPAAASPTLDVPALGARRPVRASSRVEGTIDPVTDLVTVMETPSFRVHFQPLRRSIPDIFKPYQLYPGDKLRPIDDIRNDDFVTCREPGLITPRTRVSVLGSCFAYQFKKWLVEHDYNFCQFEDGPLARSGSLRCGPIFNTRSLCQVVEWASHGFDPDVRYWPVDEWLYDPYRKAICWPDEASAQAERAAHFEAVRRMLAATEVLIVTLGLSEVWRNRRDGCAFYLMPPPEVFDDSKHEHALLTVDENVENLESFYRTARAANPDLRMIITLSPVPLVATYLDRHAVVSDAVSKATLRVALDVFCRAHPEVIYFPSYEIATRLPDWPYLDDNRHIRQSPTVDRIMSTFIRHYGDGEPAARPRGLIASRQSDHGRPVIDR